MGDTIRRELIRELPASSEVQTGLFKQGWLMAPRGDRPLESAGRSIWDTI
jgi:hypothetical protein